MPSRSHTIDWIFDVDNTLYPRSCNLFAQIDQLITKYVMDVTSLDAVAARRLQKDYYRDHGTTMNGLMKFHGVDPHHYLSKVHQIDYSSVGEDRNLLEMIERLPGRKFVFTNADMGHAQSVLTRLSGEDGSALDLFDGYFDIVSAGFSPKPNRDAYEAFVEKFGIDVSRAVMFDDLEKNLKVPHDLGMRTVQVIADDDFKHDLVEDWELERTETAPHIHHRTQNLSQFLGEL